MEFGMRCQIEFDSIQNILHIIMRHTISMITDNVLSLNDDNDDNKCDMLFHGWKKVSHFNLNFNMKYTITFGRVVSHDAR